MQPNLDAVYRWTVYQIRRLIPDVRAPEQRRRRSFEQRNRRIDRAATLPDRRA